MLTFKTKITLFRTIIVLTFVALTVQVWQLQIVEGEKYRLKADRNRFRLVEIDAPRGVIYDRNNNILVQNKPSFTVGIVPADLPEDNIKQWEVYAHLSTLLGLPISTEDQPRQRSTPGGILALVDPALVNIPQPGIREVVEADDHSDYDFVPIQTNVDREKAFIIEEEHLNLPGVQVKVEPIRQYLKGPLTTHIIGYVGRISKERVEDYIRRGYNANDRVGLVGVELTFEDQLRGTKGRKHIEVDVAGREVRTVGEPEPAQPGCNLVLAIDLDLQQVMEAALQRGMNQVGAESGVVIAMNPQTGEVLGMVSLPTYDNNLFASGISVEDYRRLSTDPNHPLVNHAISGQYPPGSTFKIIPASAALEEEVIDPYRTIFICKGTLWVPNKFFPDNPDLAQAFRCWNESGHGPVNFVQGIAQSCDIYFYQIAGGYGDFEGLGLERLSEYATLFGLGEVTGIDLPGESAGLVPTATWKRLTYAESWVTGDTYNMAIGQGFVLVTPLQILNATAAVANGGTLYRPQILYQITDAKGEVIRPFQKEVIRQIPVSGENLALVREGLRAAVTMGTAQEVNLPQVSVAGKTGTAEYPGPRDYRGNLPTHAWFTAFAPFEEPQIALVVFVAGGGEGSQTAVPIAAEILNHYFPPPEESPLEGEVTS